MTSLEKLAEDVFAEGRIYHRDMGRYFVCDYVEKGMAYNAAGVFSDFELAYLNDVASELWNKRCNLMFPDSLLTDEQGMWKVEGRT